MTSYHAKTRARALPQDGVGAERALVRLTARCYQAVAAEVRRAAAASRRARTAARAPAFVALSVPAVPLLSAGWLSACRGG